MALAMEGFSIREYASRMRSVDVGKCWPFDEANEEDVRAVLPPITIKKFSWWFDELELADGNNTVKDDDDDEEELSDLESETLECLRMKKVQKRKSVKVKKVNLKKAKAPKKRSIVELFAVAPQVERVNSDEDDDENGDYSDDEEDSNDGSCNEDDLHCKSKRKVKKKGIVSMLKKEKMVLIKNLKNKDEGKKRKKKKEKGKRIAVDLSSPRKDKSSKLKLQTSVDFVANSNCSTYRKDLFEAIATHLKKPRLKRLTMEKKKCKTPSTSKLLQNDQEALFPVRGILKSHTKVFPAENSTDSISNDTGKLTHSNIQHDNKHVSFSGSDDLLEPRRKTYPTAELELQHFCDSASDISGASLTKGHIKERGKSLSIQEMKETELEISNCTANEVEVQHIPANQLSSRYHVADAPNYFLQEHVFSRGNLLNASVSFGQGPLHVESPQWFEGCNRVTSRDALYTCSSGIPSMSQEHNNPKLTVPMFGYSSDASVSSRRLLDLSADTGLELHSGCSMDYLKAYPQPPLSYLSIAHENANTRPLFPSQNMRQNQNEHAFSYQWFPHLSPKELMRTICSLPDWNSRVAMCGETSVNEDFIGLPLNSQGEFISLNSSSKEGFNHLRSMSSLRGPSLSSPMHKNVLPNSMVNHIDIRSWNGMTQCKNQLQSCRIKDSGKEIENFILPSGLDMIEHYGIGRRNTVMKGSDPYFYSLESDMDQQVKASHFKSRHNDQDQKHPGDEIIRQHGDPDHISLHVTRSTMRLMGQEFTIGGRGLEGLEDRDLWTDKQIITECSGNIATEASSIKSPNMPEFIVHPILGKLKETATHLSKAKIEQASESAPLMMVPESKTSLHFFDSHNSVMQQNGDGMSKGILMPEMYPHFSLVSSSISDSHKSTLQNQFSSAYKSPAESPRISIPASTLLDCSQNVNRSDARLENKQIPVPAAQLAFTYPFSQSECGRQIHPSWSQNSFKVMPQRLLETRQRGPLMGYSQSPSSPGTVYHPCSMSGINFQTDPSLIPRPEPFYSFPSSGSVNSFASASLAQRPSVPVHSGFSPNSSMPNRRGDKEKFGNQIKSGFSVQIPTHGKRSKKRVPSALDDSMKSPKIPKLGIQEDSNCAIAVRTGNNFEGEAQCGRQVLEPGSAEDNADTVECGQNGVCADERGDCTRMDSFKLASALRSGPMKLTAGARYILKPCQKNDHVNSKSITSNIPVAAPITDRRVLGSEKSSKIYMF